MNLGKWAFITSLAALLPCLTFAQEIRFLEFDSFTFESGVTVPNVKLAYQIRGALNDDKSNAILLPSYYAADHNGYDIVIGADKELDPKKYCLVLTNMFANGVSSSPNNTPAPFNGPNFPRVSIRDNVEAQHRLIRETLGIAKLKAIIGFSMGGQQAFQWAVSHPDMMDSIVVICGNAKQYPFGIVRLQGSIAAIKADDDFKGGNYSSPPEKGLAALEMHYRAWSRAPAAWPRDLFDNLSDEELEGKLESFTEGSRAADANNLLSHAETWKRHDVGDTPGYNGNLETALRSIKARVLLMPSTTDQYFPMSDSEFESRLIADVDLRPIQSLFGHSAGADPDAAKFIDESIRSFLNHSTGPTAD